MDVIMSLGTVIFFILFCFLLFQFVVFLWSLFYKEKFVETYEPYVSILIPVYNEEKNIQTCLDSVLASPYPQDKYEIVIIDDGSTDSTISLLEKYPVRVVKQNHGGKTAALNYGCKVAKYDIIAIIDADTIVEPEFLHELMKPYADEKVGATSGTAFVRNPHSFLGRFQQVEYHYNNLIRQLFSRLFDTGVWFFGSVSSYRREVVEKIGLFSQDTMAEDMDSALAIERIGFKTINVMTARAYTNVPSTVRGLYNQRRRWWVGGLQSLKKHNMLFSRKSNVAVNFLFINQYWWTFYSFIAIPLIAYQVYFWFPVANEAALYLLRWFSAIGPFYVLYKIPEWGINYYNIFGVISGLISTSLLLYALKIYKENFSFGMLLAILFYFPYTILLNAIIMVGVLKTKETYFIR